MRLSRGDTIIEVLLAITVFSLLSVGTMTIMNQGTNAAQRALEITLVRQQIDAQAEAIRAAQQAAASDYRAAWDAVALNSSTPHYPFGATCPVSTADIPQAFVMDPRNARVLSAGNWLKDINSSTSVPYAQVIPGAPGVVESYGMWIERDYRATAGNIPALYTFTIKACWRGAGVERPLNLETVVRLYDPGS